MIKIAKQDQIRTQLQNKIFTPYGKTVTLYTPSTSITFDEYGDRDTDTVYSEDNLIIVDYDIIDPRKEHPMWGDLQIGDRMAIVTFDSVVDVDNYLEIGSQKFKIVEIERPSLPDTVVNILRMTKTTDSLTVGTTEVDNLLFIDNNNFVFIDGNNFTFIN